MSIDIGITGLPQSGKTTIFNALTAGKVETLTHATDSYTPHVGIARIPDPRLKTLKIQQILLIFLLSCLYLQL